jgi:ABC-type transporter Mla subunit MlaD
VSVVCAAIDGRDVGVIIGILCGALGALTTFTWAIFRIAKGIAGDVAQINRAVNHQPDSEPKLIDRIKSLVTSVQRVEETTGELRSAAERHEVTAKATRDRVAQLEATASRRYEELLAGLGKLEDGHAKIHVGMGALDRRLVLVEAGQAAAATVATERDDRNENRSASPDVETR